MAEAEARDVGTTSASGPGTQAPPVAHDDIMRRLLEYQRRLREGMSPSEAAAAVAEGIPDAPAGGTESQGVAATEETTVVDLTKAEAELEARTEAASEPQTEPGEARTEAAEPSAIGDRSEAATFPTPAEPSTPAEAPVAEAPPAPPEAAPPTPSPEQEPQIPAWATPPSSVWATPPSSVWATPSPAPDLVARVERLERALEEVATKVSDLRQRFQDLAVAADERLAELERILGRAQAR